MRLPLIFQDESKRNTPLWLIIFSDMSTNLMLFFLMLFAMTRMTDVDRQALIEGMDNALVNKHAIEQRQKIQQAQGRALVALTDTLAHGKLKQYAKIEDTKGSTKLTIEMPFFFDTGSAAINPKAMQALEGLTTALKEFPHRIVIEGHTDSTPVTGGRYPSNWELSVARAVSVIEFFVQRGVNPKKLVTGGYGQYHPAYDNDTIEHRALNRRIEITLIKNKGDS